MTQNIKINVKSCNKKIFIMHKYEEESKQNLCHRSFCMLQNEQKKIKHQNNGQKEQMDITLKFHNKLITKGKLNTSPCLGT